MRILLVEDEPDLGTAIQWALKQEKYVVDWAQDGAAGWDYLESGWLQYSVMILDWLLPKIMGVELCQRLRAKQNPLPVLMLTAKDRMADKIAGLDAGADDYLVKPFDMEELLARLRALQRRSPYLPVQQLQLGCILLNYTERTVYYQTNDDPTHGDPTHGDPTYRNPTNRGQLQPIALTHKEFQLLEYFMSHSHQILSTEQLLCQLWEADTQVASNVVAAQIRLLRRKLAEQGCHDFIETVPSMGYRIHPRYAQ